MKSSAHEQTEPHVNPRSDRFRPGLFILLLLASAGVVKAGQAHQDMQEAAPGQPVLKAETDLVSFNVTVSDERNQPVEGLRRENFRVYEDEVEQELRHFSNDDAPYTLGLVLDRSGSMSLVIDDVYNAAFHAVRASKPEDEFFAITFNHKVDLLQEFTSDQKVLRSRLKGVDADGSTALYDAIYTGLKHLGRGHHDKKALLVVTDGEDNASFITLKGMLAFIRERKVSVYVVGFFGGMSPSSPLLLDTPLVDILKKIAEVTGGKAYFPKSMKECDEACIAIANELRKQYSLGYYPANHDRDGGWRTIRVELDMPAMAHGGKHSARTREGYYAPTQ